MILIAHHDIYIYIYIYIYIIYIIIMYKYDRDIFPIVLCFCNISDIFARGELYRSKLKIQMYIRFINLDNSLNRVLQQFIILKTRYQDFTRKYRISISRLLFRNHLRLVKITIKYRLKII